MKNFKRTIAFILSLTLMSTMAACSDDSGSASNETTTKETTTVGGRSGSRAGRGRR